MQKNSEHNSCFLYNFIIIECTLKRGHCSQLNQQKESFATLLSDYFYSLFSVMFLNKLQNLAIRKIRAFQHVQRNQSSFKILQQRREDRPGRGGRAVQSITQSFQSCSRSRVRTRALLLLFLGWQFLSKNNPMQSKFHRVESCNTSIAIAILCSESFVSTSLYHHHWRASHKNTLDEQKFLA